MKVFLFFVLMLAITHKDDLEENSSNLAQEVLYRGHAATYENEDGLLIEEFPDGRIFHIDVDLKTGKTIYLK
ncbi:MAG: hypothetical protein L3J43_04030 [Sulfurovum sp.]|nr:hypothetical protein [Sulfurovum sp.]